jgi:cytochrome c-type biogenesis protein CcmH
MSRLLLLLGMLLLSSLAHADAALEARVQAVSEQLRCVVCQNQSIAESDADLARDLRRQVREMLAAGQDEAAVRTFMVERYGDFVLYDPPLKPATWLLWLGPVFLLLAALAGFWLRLRRRQPAAPPDEQARARARALLQDDQTP